MENISEKLVGYMLRNKVISEDDKEIYLFGLVLMLRVLLNTVTLILIGLWFNMLAVSATFVCFSLFIRSYSGGFHSDNPVICYLISTSSIILLLISIKLQIWNVYISGILVILSTVIFLIYAPVGHKNKILEDIESKIYRRRLLKIVFGLLCLMSIFTISNLKYLLYAGSFAFGMSAFMIILVQINYLISGSY
ncbi:accessory gene regulator ArgB-like protein [Lachnoanaerobaculum gingivalis]|uniref:accessory gene regulator ArgB-like protein n=1 Tax=Lachnoanaerobaculum gingivalis TaxID=2490855 RepID=UPI0024A74159|nr:accessory gene regulator B family protein [Lachnoanaerobaculum gingivalis]WHE86294.1 accessory gene regulator B family protein [Lachnoanaerobaculum gingivalis]